MKLTNESAEKMKEQFPIFRREIEGKRIIYLDNAATTQKPWSVINAISDYYSTHNANVHRGIYTLGEEASTLYEDAKKAVAEFINVNADEIIFTKGTTESLNLVAWCIWPLLKGKKEIVVTETEHHADLIPWQQLCECHGLTLKRIPLKEDFTLDYAAAQEMITEDTGLVAMGHVSNSLGTVNDVKVVAQMAHDKGALMLVDAAQSIGHMNVDVEALGCDFLAFSSHKMMGPMGIGVLYGRKELLQQMNPYQTGGDMIKEVTYESATWADAPLKFEAGTQNVAGAVGLHAAIKFINEVGRDVIHEWDGELLSYGLERFKELKTATVYNAGHKNSAGIISFGLSCAQPSDIAALLNEDGICIRAGHHCAMPLMNKLEVPGTCRASFYIYNTKEDVDALIDGLKRIEEKFG